MLLSDEELLISPSDTVIVLREDGVCEVSFPEIDENEPIPENVITGAAILNAIRDEELSELIHECFALQCERYALMDAVNDN